MKYRRVNPRAWVFVGRPSAEGLAADPAEPAHRALAAALMDALRESPSAAYVDLLVLASDGMTAIGADGAHAECGISREDAARVLAAALRQGCTPPEVRAVRALHVRDMVLEAYKDRPPRCFREVALAAGGVPRCGLGARPACVMIAGRRQALPPAAFPCVAELHLAEDVQRVSVELLGEDRDAPVQERDAPVQERRNRPDGRGAELIIEAVVGQHDASPGAALGWSSPVFRARARVWRGCRMGAARALAACL